MPTNAHGNFSDRKLVVFGAGYIGGTVAAHARAAGAQVTAITRNAHAAETIRAQGMDVVVADIVEGRWHDRVPSSPDFVLYCASGGGAGLDGYARSYRQGLATVIDWLKDRGAASALVYTSSTSVYPQGGGALVDESSATATPGEDRIGILAATEQAIMTASKAYARAFILRLSGIYGPQRHALLDEVRTGCVSGDPESHLNLIHRDDVVSAILRSFESPTAGVGGVFNVSDGSPATRGEIAHWVSQQLGLTNPQFTGAMRSTRRPMPLDRVILNEKIRRQLDWTPKYPSYREGYRGLFQEPPAMAL